MLRVSIPAKDCVPAVTLVKVRVCESAVPLTSLNVKVTLCAVSDTETAAALLIPVTVKPPVPLDAANEVIPVTLAIPIVATAVLLIVTLSMPTIEEGVTEPVMVAVRVSVPAPPLSTSLVVSVCKPVELKEPSNVSLPVLPVKLFVPVVSVKVEPAT